MLSLDKVVVGMSGGVDSFVTALLLLQQGYEVVGAYLQLWGEDKGTEVEILCREIGIPLVVQDGRRELQSKVIEPFVQDYLAGLTPSPCCTCNRHVKWKLLEEVAERYGAAHIATGHYVRIVRQDGRYYIKKGKDPVKDQSYFLWGVSQQTLSKALTPIGGFTKTEVKSWAAGYGYTGVTRQKESMGVCFLQGENYRDFICHYSGCMCAPGNIKNREGKLIGTHTGLLNYTIGQKRGMPMVEGEPMYVAQMNAGENLIIADRKSALYTGSLVVGQVALVREEDLFGPNVEIKVRGLGLNPAGYVRVEKLGERRYRIHLSEPAWAVAPGQPVAFYREELLIGGGIAELQIL